MIANPVSLHLSAVPSTALGPVACRIDPELRQQGEDLLRDLAFVLHLTRKVKRQILAEESLLAGASQD